MVTPTRRRARGSGAARTAVYAEVAPSAAALLDDMVEASGAAKWSVLESILEHVRSELDENGLPKWWPSPPTQQEVLDISA